MKSADLERGAQAARLEAFSVELVVARPQRHKEDSCLALAVEADVEGPGDSHVDVVDLNVIDPRILPQVRGPQIEIFPAVAGDRELVVLPGFQIEFGL